ESRAVGLSGIRYADPKLNKNHTDTHHIGDVGRIDVYYGIDGETPVHVHFYLKVDKGFTRLDRLESVDKRLCWEQAAFSKVVKHVEKRWREHIVWEIDAEQETKLNQGVDSGDYTIKLQALEAWGKQCGYRLDHRAAKGKQTPRWSWYQGDRLMIEVYHDRGF